MTALHKIFVFLNWFGVGILMPVLSLIFLARGCTLQTLSIVLGIYSVTVIVAELPTGIIADLYGRRTAFFLSCLSNAICFIILFFTSHLFLAAAAMLFQGLGRAFSSGSVDALVIEQSVEQCGEASLARVTSQLCIFQCTGIAAGALLGGFLPNLHHYALHIAVRVVLLLIVALLGFLFLRETKPDCLHRPSLSELLMQSKSFLMDQRRLRYLLLCIGVMSLMLFLLQTYWQPALKSIAPESPQNLLGVLCAAGFTATTLGSYILGRKNLVAQRRQWVAYLVLALAMAVSVFVFALQNSTAGFAILYIFAYFFLGAINVPEQTILNAAVPNEIRASMLSAASLACQIGAVLGSLLCSFVIGKVGISGVWLIAASLTFGVVILTAMKVGKR